MSLSLSSQRCWVGKRPKWMMSRISTLIRLRTRLPSTGFTSSGRVTPASRGTKPRQHCPLCSQRFAIWFGPLIWTNVRSCLLPSVSPAPGPDGLPYSVYRSAGALAPSFCSQPTKPRHMERLSPRVLVLAERYSFPKLARLMSKVSLSVPPGSVAVDHL